MHFQERGRGSRCQGEQSTCIVYGNLPSYVYLRIQLFANANDVDDYAHSSILDGDGHNVAISPRKQARILTKKKTYPLSVMVRRTLRLRTQMELHEVIRFFVSISDVSMHQGIVFINRCPCTDMPWLWGM